MKKVPTPDKLSTRQDLLNACGHMHHAEAAIYLKRLKKEDLKRIGVSAQDIKTIRTGLSERKRTEIRKKRALYQKKVNLEAVRKRLDQLSNDYKSGMASLNIGKNAKSILDGKNRDLTGLQEKLNTLRELPEQKTRLKELCTGLDTIVMELDAIAEVDGKDLKRLVQTIGEKKEIISRLRNALHEACVTEAHKRRANQVLEEIRAVTDEIRKIRADRDAMLALEADLKKISEEIEALKTREARLIKEVSDAE